MDTWQPTLPGLTPPTPETGALTDAAIATVAALESDGLLEPRHALTVQLVLGLAQNIDRAMSAGKVTVALAQSTKQLLDALAALPAPDTTPDDAWDEMARAFAEADAAARLAAEQARK